MASSEIQGNALYFMKTIGIFGGTFDPIHFGHIDLAIQLFEKHKLDGVLFCPAFCSPFKKDKPPIASPQHRLEMVRIAIVGIPHFKISDYEIERNDLSFTIDTLQAIGEKGVKYHLLLSQETADSLDQWKDSKELIQLAAPFIGKQNFKISSTEIRERINKGLYVGHMTPVLKYIQDHGLYQ